MGAEQGELCAFCREEMNPEAIKCAECGALRVVQVKSWVMNMWFVVFLLLCFGGCAHDPAISEPSGVLLGLWFIAFFVLRKLGPKEVVYKSSH